MRFRDRRHAGELLAEKLHQYAGRDNVLMLGNESVVAELGVDEATVILVDDGIATGSTMRAAE